MVYVSFFRPDKVEQSFRKETLMTSNTLLKRKIKNTKTLQNSFQI